MELEIGDKVKIVKVNEDDGHHESSKDLEGITGTLISDAHYWEEGGISVSITLDSDFEGEFIVCPLGNELFFYSVELEKL